MEEALKLIVPAILVVVVPIQAWMLKQLISLGQWRTKVEYQLDLALKALENITAQNKTIDLLRTELITFRTEFQSVRADQRAEMKLLTERFDIVEGCIKQCKLVQELYDQKHEIREK